MWIIITVLALFLLYIFLICPCLRSHPDKNLCKKLYVAHRGLHNIDEGIPENSIKAFENAIKHNVAIEIDIHLTKDSKVVIFHDDNLNRVCGIDGIIEDMTLEQLSKCKLLGTEEKIPTLEQLLEICTDKTVLVIEFKCSPTAYKELCIKANEILSKHNVKYIVQSFNPLAMRWYKLNRKDICRGQLSSNFLRDKSKKPIEILCGFLLFNFFSRPDFISYNYQYKNNISRKICVFLGAISAAWTIKSQNVLTKNLSEYDIFIFEDFLPTKKESSF